MLLGSINLKTKSKNDRTQCSPSEPSDKTGFSCLKRQSNSKPYNDSFV